MDPLAVLDYGAEQALPLTGTGTGTGTGQTHRQTDRQTDKQTKQRKTT